jgi:hypothetical protein
MLCNTAIFYDIENLLGLFSAHNNTTVQLDEIYRRVLETEGVNGVSIQRAYTDWGLTINRNLRNSVLQIGIEPVQIFNTNQNDKVKNAADVSLIIDAVDLIQKRPDIENFVVVSGDGIFAFLAKKLHEYGKRVIGVGFTRNANIIFRNACDYYISLEKGDKSLTATSTKSAIKGQSAVALAAAAAANGNGNNNGNGNAAAPAPAEQPKPAPAAPAVKDEHSKAPTRKPGKIPAAFPKSRFTETLVNAEFPVWYKPENAVNNNGGLLAIRNMLNVLFNNADENADLEISVLMNYVNYYVSGFSVGMYNFTRFREFMRFITTASPYCIFQDGTILRVTRRGSVGTKGTLLEDSPGLIITLSDGSKLKSIFDIPDGRDFTYSLAEPEKAKQAAKKQQRKANGKPKPAPAKPAAATPAEEAAKPIETPAAPALNALNAKDEAEAAPVKRESPAVESDAPVIPGDADAQDAASGAKGDSSPVRKLIKAGFMTLSLENKLPKAECKNLTSQEYCHATFGVKAPVLREIFTKSNLQEQRLINGKVRYWKEVFKFNNKMYLVFKEWSAAVHKDRFVAWLSKFE